MRRRVVNNEDLTGRRFGTLAVLGFGWKDRTGKHWLCKCDCGKESTPTGSSLLSGKVSGCGCARIPKVRAMSLKHGQTNSSEWIAWMNAKKRCFDENCREYHRYGGRGITICERWLGDDGFQNFIADMGPKPSKKHQIDRINNDGNYEPGNCRWATVREQSRNRRSTVILDYLGESLCLTDWATKTGIAFAVLSKRSRKGWTAEKILTTPVKAWVRTLSAADAIEIRRLAEDGVPVMELAERFGVRHSQISRIVSRQRWKHV